MHVVFISQCTGKAAKRTRAILDRFSQRFGQDTWMTPMTTEALASVKQALAAVAARNTAVACYRNHGMEQMDLLWVVGSASRFAQDGQIPLHHRTRPRLPDPAWLNALRRLAAAEGMAHDFGKASINFQNKLRQSSIIGDAIRHEWVSLHLLALIAADPMFKQDVISEAQAWQVWVDAWRKLAAYPVGNTSKLHSFPGEHDIPEAKQTMGAPTTVFAALCLAVVTHHGLFHPNPKGTFAVSDGVAFPTTKGHTNREFSGATISPPKEGFIQLSNRWMAADQADMGALVRRFHATFRGLVDTARASNNHKAAAIISRAALILADHEVSARKVGSKTLHSAQETSSVSAAFTKPDGVFANTDRATHSLNQTLPYHLAQVAQRAHFWTGCFFNAQLPGINSKVRHRLLYEETVGRFSWQGECTRRLLEATDDRSLPTLVLNLAATGAGKTRMNAKAVAALTPTTEPMRMVAGFNLKTLTLQTRDAFKEELGLPQDELACLVGDRLAVALHKHPMFEDDDNLVSEDGQVDQDYDVVGDGISHLPLWLEQVAVGKKSKLRALIGAPALVSTMDYLIHAGEPGQQGHHGEALLRLSSSDLIVDEVDSYDAMAIAAILRLVYMSGMFKRNVILSSATLPMSIARSMFEAFRAGVVDGGAMRQENSTPFRVASLDNAQNPYSDLHFEGVEPAGKLFEKFYEKVVSEKSSELAEMEAKTMTPRRYRVVPVGIVGEGKYDKVVQDVANRVKHSVLELHARFASVFKDKQGQDKSVSFGLVRVANVPFCVSLSHTLLEMNTQLDDIEIHVCPYHSVDLALRRKHKEAKLDAFLKRKPGWQETLLLNSDFMARISLSAKKNVLFLVVATPVEEVGRDHDFDWAVIEPSSMASIIQTAGRVNRHRLAPINPSVENIHILQYNRKALLGAEIVFKAPGLEEEGNPYPHHDLNLLLGSSVGVLDTRMRFGTLCCPLAQLDEESLTLSLKRPMEASSGMGHMKRSWVVMSYYKKYPFRESSYKSAYRIETNEHGQHQLTKRDAVLVSTKIKGKTAYQENWLAVVKGETLTLCERNQDSPYWWLCPTIDTLNEMIESVPLAMRESAMEFEVGKFAPTSPGFNVRVGGYQTEKP